MPVISLKDSKDVHEYVKRVYEELARCALFAVAYRADRKSYYLLAEKYGVVCQWCPHMAEIVVADQEQIVCAQCYERYVL